MARTIGSEGGKTEAAIRDAAIILIARHGFEAVTMRMLASAVGVQPAALYRYFPNKEDLLNQLMLDHMQALLESWSSRDQRSASPTQRFGLFIEHHIDFHLQRRPSTHVSNLELRSLSDLNRQPILALRSRYENGLREILKDGLAQGDFIIDDLDLATMAIIQMITGIIVWFKPEERLSAEELTATYRKMALRLIGVTP